MNFFNGKLEDGKFIIGKTTISIPEGKMKFLREQGYVGKTVILGIRPEDIHDEPVFIDASAGTKIQANVDVAELTGAELMVYSNIDGQDFVARLDSRSDIKPGDKVELAFDLNKGHFFDTDSELRIRP
jgi:multiple sugar transport system ATP-binding protein